MDHEVGAQVCSVANAILFDRPGSARVCVGGKGWWGVGCEEVLTAVAGPSESHQQESASWEMVLTLTVLLLCIFLTYVLLISRLRWGGPPLAVLTRCRWLPESCATILLGMVCGVFFRLNGSVRGCPTDPLLDPSSLCRTWCHLTPRLFSSTSCRPSSLSQATRCTRCAVAGCACGVTPAGQLLHQHRLHFTVCSHRDDSFHGGGGGAPPLVVRDSRRLDSEHISRDSPG